MTPQPPAPLRGCPDQPKIKTPKKKERPNNSGGAEWLALGFWPFHRCHLKTSPRMVHDGWLVLDIVATRLRNRQIRVQWRDVGGGRGGLLKLIQWGGLLLIPHIICVGFWFFRAASRFRLRLLLLLLLLRLLATDNSHSNDSHTSTYTHQLYTHQLTHINNKQQLTYIDGSPQIKSDHNDRMLEH